MRLGACYAPFFLLFMLNFLNCMKILCFLFAETKITLYLCINKKKDNKQFKDYNHDKHNCNNRNLNSRNF